MDGGGGAAAQGAGAAGAAGYIVDLTPAEEPQYVWYVPVRPGGETTRKKEKVIERRRRKKGRKEGRGSEAERN